MTDVLDRPRTAGVRRASAATTSSEEVIVSESAEYEDTGSRDRARPWQGAKGRVCPRPVAESSNLFLGADEDSVVIWLGEMSCLIDGGTADSIPWCDLRFVLAASAIEIPRVAEVRSYLNRHSDMYEVTEKICKAARREFGPEASLILQVYRDPEIEDEYLALFVRLRDYAPDTLSRIRSVVDAFDNELCQASGSILLTTDFRPLR